MRLREDIKFEDLEALGFSKVTPDNYMYTNSWGEFIYDLEGNYAYDMDGGRRGQDYFLLVNIETRNLAVFSTEPDGSGAEADMPDVIVELIQRGWVVKDERIRFDKRL